MPPQLPLVLSKLVKVIGFDKAEGAPGNLSPADFLDYQRDATTFERMGANGWVGLATISGGRGDSERAGWVQVTEGFFPTLRVQPAIGRAISAEDDRPGAADQPLRARVPGRRTARREEPGLTRRQPGGSESCSARSSTGRSLG